MNDEQLNTFLTVAETGSFSKAGEGSYVSKQAMLRQIACPVVYLKASTDYGDDGVLYAATTDADAARIQETIPDCQTTELKSGHDIHYEHPDVFIGAVDQAVSISS